MAHSDGKAKELIAVAARCDITGISRNDGRSQRKTNLETLGLAIYMTPDSAEFEGGRPHAYGGKMSWNMFSRFGAGSDPDIVSFGDLEEAVGTNAWTVVDVREPHEFAAGHIPNALNMPMSSFDPRSYPRESRSCSSVSPAGGRAMR